MNKNYTNFHDTRLCLFFILIIFMSACDSNKKGSPNLTQPLNDTPGIFAIWKRTDIIHHYTSKEQEEMMKKYPISYDKDYYMSLFPDGKGSFSFKTELDSFIWEVKDESTLHIPIKTDLVTTSREIKLKIEKGDTLLSLKDINGIEEMIFTKSSALTSDYKEDPNYPYNNLWRFRAQQTISDSDIELKVNNYLKHYEYLFKASLDKNSNRRFTNKHSKGPLKIYRSAVGIIERNKISDDWYSYFYNSQEALKAYDMLKAILNENKLKKTGSDNWVKDNYEILKAINNSTSQN